MTLEQSKTAIKDLICKRSFYRGWGLTEIEELNKERVNNGYPDLPLIKWLGEIKRIKKL